MRMRTTCLLLKNKNQKICELLFALMPGLCECNERHSLSKKLVICASECAVDSSMLQDAQEDADPFHSKVVNDLMMIKELVDNILEKLQ